MKKTQNRFLTRTQILRLAPLLFCTTAATATPVFLNEANSTNVWTLPTGTNLLNGALVTDPAAPNGANHGNGDITSSNWATLTDGSLGSAGNQLSSVAPLNNTTAVFPLNTTVNTNGYTITQFDSYCAWPDSGRDNQNFVIEYSTVSDPATFLPLATVANAGTTGNATHTNITDSSGVLATNVGAIRFTFANQENGYVGYREFILLGTAVPLGTPLTWSGASGTGGNANWIAGADNNWKLTTGGTASNFSSLSPLTFDSSATNRNITLPAALTASSLSFTNNATSPYTFNGSSLLTVPNSLTGTNAGAVTFNNPVSFATGLAMSGSGSLTFNGALESNGINLTGTGSVTLNASNNLTGTTAVSNGALKVTNNNGLGTSPLSVSGGSVSFTTIAPTISGLQGAGGSLVLGNTTPVVNTTLTVLSDDITNYAGAISNASGAKGGLTKDGLGALTLSGTNTYTGVTNVRSGQLYFGQRTSLYNATTASWTAANLLASPDAVLGFRVGGTGEFVDSDFAALKTGGMQADSRLGFDTTSGNASIATALSGSFGLFKTGDNALTLSGANTFTGNTLIVRGTVNAANPSGHSIGSTTLGDTTFNAFLNFGANDQFKTGSVLTLANGSGASNSKVQLMGTTQTLEGLESTPVNRLSIIQNDEPVATGAPFSTAPATLILNTTTDHSFFGLIRNGSGDNTIGALSIVKNGPATQELLNSPVQNTGFTGPTIINNGMLKLTYNGGAYISPVQINSPGVFGLDGTFTIGQTMTGNGKVMKQGGGTVTLTGTQSTYSGGTIVNEGTLIMSGNGSTGEGTAAGDHCIAGVMDPANVVTVNNGAALQLDGIAPLGNSNLLPQFAPTIQINENSLLSGGNNTVAFVPNLKLNGGLVSITDGAGHGGFNTNLTFVGTVTVGGTSTFASSIYTVGTGANANISLGTVANPVTTFQVADVTGNVSEDLTVDAVMQNVHGTPSTLIKTGPGTMHVLQMNNYTGNTQIDAGTFVVDQPYFFYNADILVGSAATLNLNFPDQVTIRSFKIGGTNQAPGIYGSSTNTTPGIIKTPRITGSGTLQVTGVIAPPSFDDWASANITDTTKRGRTDDPDGDGYNNLQEFMFGLNPAAIDGPPVKSEKNANGLLLHWNQRNATGTYTLQESTDLVTWTTSTAAISDDPVQSNPDYTLKQATVPVTGVRKFVRVQAAE